MQLNIGPATRSGAISSTPITTPSERVTPGRNLLQRLNRDLQGDADPTQFRYRAHWQARQQRIEMALVSTQDQTVHLGGEAWFFRQGDDWITEHSVKYSTNAAATLAAQAGWRIHTGRSLCICFCRQTEPTDKAQELRRHEIRRTASGHQTAA